MDFVKKAVQGSGEKKDQNAQGGTGTEQKDDYVDKGMASRIASSWATATKQ